MPSVEGLKLKDPKNLRYLGKGEIGIVDLHDSTTGAARYGADVRLPGMKYAVIARPPVTGGKVVSFDGSEAMKVSGVEKVLEVKAWPWPSKFQPFGGVAVIARRNYGEPMAALINAIFAAIGKRIRALPLGKQLET